MSWKLYIDDIRTPSDSNEWVIARTSRKAISLIQSLGFPHKISFDHDLGDDDDAMKVAKWIVNTDLDKEDNGELNWIPANFSFVVHSANPTGKQNIEGLLSGYLKHKKERK
jgi:hypothetical protein